MKTYLLKLFTLLILGFALLKAPFLGPTVDAFCLLLAKITYALISPFDSAVVIEGAVYYWKSYAYAIEVTKECSALGYTLVLVCAIMLYPGKWSTRLKAALISVLFIQAVNVFRLIALLYGRVLFVPENFNILHYQFLPFLISLSTLLFFVIYAGRYGLPGFKRNENSAEAI